MSLNHTPKCIGKMQTTGVNGANVYTPQGTGDMRVAFYTSLLRDMTAAEVRQFVRETLDEGERRGSLQEYIRDLWVMAFQTRDVRGGKGERVVALELFAVMAERFPATAQALLPLLSEFGSWRDMFYLMVHHEHLKSGAMAVVSKQFWADRAAMKAKKSPSLLAEGCKEGSATPSLSLLAEGRSLSLLAKWMPREKAQTFKAVYRYIIKSLYPDLETEARSRQYRKHVSEMNKALQTTEIKMCGKEWAMIKPGQVPGRCLMKNKDAFYNIKDKKGKKTQRSTDPDRINCAENFREHMKRVAAGEETIKGKSVVYPHEIIGEIQKLSRQRERYEECAAVRDCEHYWSNSDCDDSDSEDQVAAREVRRRTAIEAEDPEVKSERLQQLAAIDEQIALLEAQWKSIVAEFVAGAASKKILPLCDFSGSMEGVPMNVAMALGIIISEIAHPAFKNKVITFSNEPAWIDLPPNSTLLEKIRILGDAPWGMNTNFEAAYKLVLDKMIESRVPVGEEPEDLIVFTDMGFDQAVTYNVRMINDLPHMPKKWMTALKMLKEEYIKASEMVHGLEGGQWTPPRLTIWNLRAEYKEYHATVAEPGVLQLSGWSPSAIKVLTEGINVGLPYDGFRKLMDDERYARVRATVSQL
jgi:Domain of unknown function (DUF2828)